MDVVGLTLKHGNKYKLPSALANNTYAVAKLLECHWVLCGPFFYTSLSDNGSLPQINRYMHIYGHHRWLQMASFFTRCKRFLHPKHRWIDMNMWSAQNLGSFRMWKVLWRVPQKGSWRRCYLQLFSASSLVPQPLLYPLSRARSFWVALEPRAPPQPRTSERGKVQIPNVDVPSILPNRTAGYETTTIRSRPCSRMSQ